MAKLRGAPRSPKENPCISLTAAALLHAVVPPDQAMPRGSLRYENSRFRLRKKKKVGKTGNVSRASPALHRSAGNSEAEIRS